MKPVLLWSDALFFLLLAICLGGIWWARRSPQLSAAWREVGKSRAGVASATVLKLSARATGKSLRATTVSVTTTDDDKLAPSLAAYEKLSVP